jgi:segregation and condensation protein B
VAKAESSETALDILLEAVLFTASEPLTAARLAEATGSSADAVAAALEALRGRLTGGTRLAAAEGSYRLTTAPAAADTVRQFVEATNRQELSRPALEALAIIAYKGPITKSSLDTVRGVASDAMVRNLLARGLITEAGRSSEPGKPVLYAVSHAFLQHFGLSGTHELPPLPEAPPGED